MAFCLVGCFKNMESILPGLPVVGVSGCAGVVGGVLVDERKDTGKASVANCLARDWKDMLLFKKSH